MLLSLIATKDAIFDKGLNLFAASDANALRERDLFHTIFEVQCEIEIFVLEKHSAE